MLTIAFVTGTEPGKWFRRYEQYTSAKLDTVQSDDAFAQLDAGADMALMRLPDARVTDEFHVVRLYTEAAGVAVPKDSVYAGETLTVDDIEGEIINFEFTEQSLIDDLRSALQIVAANVGVALAPLPLLRALSKKQIAVCELTADPGSHFHTEVALVWRVADDSPEIQEFVGVAKGRTPNSSRSQGAGASQQGKRAKQTAPRGNAQNRSAHKRKTRKRPR